MLALPVGYSGTFLPGQPAAAGGGGQCRLLHRPHSLWLVLPLQANVEHMTEKMKTEIQRGLVLR